MTDIARLFGIEFPVFAFSHCRDVVAAVSGTGGLGVFGASVFTPEEIEIELDWIDRHSHGAPYGIDFAFPPRATESVPGAEPDLPAQHRAFVEDLLNRYGVAEFPAGTDEERATYRGVDFGDYDEALEVVYRHPNCRLVVSALGTPPSGVVERAHAEGRLVAALAGKPEHAVRSVAAGVDIIVAQGSEAGGHAGSVSTMVLAPQVVDAVAPTPVLVAGGIASGRQMAAAMALGGAGVWTGSMWLATEESDLSPEMVQKIVTADSWQTVQTRSITGKPCRVVRSAWSDAWEAEGSPKPLPMPAQGFLVEDAMRRIERASRDRDSGGLELLTCPAGQVIGQLTKVSKASRLLLDMVEEYIECVEDLERRLVAE
ncbi:nitronate monooxygenase [Sporichthya polymorpha]|uniref:nitronate monooxygenase n=1 Tax=Sporichthya polymorpha TaxID=35751 RepID=UPI000361D2ED|nr:nitronate monooxygenase family protein [Sporichthya polymorpha]